MHHLYVVKAPHLPHPLFTSCHIRCHFLLPKELSCHVLLVIVRIDFFHRHAVTDDPDLAPLMIGMVCCHSDAALIGQAHRRRLSLITNTVAMTTTIATATTTIALTTIIAVTHRRRHRGHASTTTATTTKATGVVTMVTTTIAAATAATTTIATTTTHGKCTGWRWWCTTKTPEGACWGVVDDDVIGFYGACVLLLLAREDHTQEGNLLVHCFRRVASRAVHPVGKQIRAAILPH
jgi:hypothetical protein